MSFPKKVSEKQQLHKHRGKCVGDGWDDYEKLAPAHIEIEAVKSDEKHTRKADKAGEHLLEGKIFGLKNESRQNYDKECRRAAEHRALNARGERESDVEEYIL